MLICLAVLVSTGLAASTEEFDTGVPEPEQIDFNRNPQSSDNNDIDILVWEEGAEDSFDGSMEVYEMNGKHFDHLIYPKNMQNLETVTFYYFSPLESQHIEEFQEDHLVNIRDTLEGEEEEFDYEGKFLTK